MSKEDVFNGNKIIAKFMMYSKFGDIDLSNMNELEKSYFLEECRYDLNWDYLMPVFNKFTKDFDISWKISSTMVSLYNPQTNLDGRWEINCPENVIIDAWKGALSFTKTLIDIKE
jgi:hypothetical protein